MGRHAKPAQSGVHLAGWVWAALMALLLIIALVIGWFAINKTNSAGSEKCPDGDYSLAVWAAPEAEGTAQSLIDSYNEEDHVVEDSCVKATAQTMSDDDAVKALSEDNNTVPAVWMPNDPQRAIEAARSAGASINTSTVTMQEGKYAVLPLSAADNQDTVAAGAASDLTNLAAKQSGENTQVPLAELDPTMGQAPAPEAQPEQPAEPAPAPAAAAPLAQSTFVLDTSGSMGLVEGEATRLDNVRGAMQEEIDRLGQNGTTISLWNYSSPLSDSARTPYRPNVALEAQDKGQRALEILARLTFGGATHTYESVLAAYRAAVDAAVADQPTRVVLITDGPNDGGAFGLETAVAQIQELHGRAPVQLNVVTIGDNVNAAAMEQLAAAGGGQVHHAADSTVVREALGAAVAQ